MRNDAIVTVLSVSPLEEDHRSLEYIFAHCKWALHRAEGVAAAIAALRNLDIGVVLAERDLPPDSWADLCHQMSSLPQGPPLIVTARTADEKLWSEALHLGAYDVLNKPFDRLELFRSISSAWRHWRARNEAPPMVMRAAG